MYSFCLFLRYLSMICQFDTNKQIELDLKFYMHACHLLIYKYGVLENFSKLVRMSFKWVGIHDSTEKGTSWNGFPCIFYLVIMETSDMSIFLLNISNQCSLLNASEFFFSFDILNTPKCFFLFIRLHHPMEILYIIMKMLQWVSLLSQLQKLETTLHVSG